MSGLWVGTAGFIIAILADFLSAGRFRILARLGFWISIFFFIFALYETIFRTDRFNLPVLLVWAGRVILPISLALLIYSLFIELPFLSTHTGKGEPQALITGGTYALTRHPGLLWFGLFMLSLLLASRSKELLLGAPVWFSLDLLWVILQDRFIFVKLFRNYHLYQHQTPMLFPSFSSLKRCVATLGKVKNSS